MRVRERQVADMEKNMTEQRLLEKLVKNKFSISIHSRLAEYYLKTGKYADAEKHQEIIEYIARIRRMCRN